MTEANAAAVDAIRELINIGVGRAAGMLNDITGRTIILQVPLVRIVGLDELSAINGYLQDPALSMVSLNFRGPMSGLAALVFPQESARSLVLLMTGETEKTPELDILRTETLKEVGNIIVNAVMGSIANILDHHFTYAVPSYHEASLATLVQCLKTTADDRVVLANAHFQIENTSIDGNILLILEIGSMDTLLSSIQRVSP